VEALARDQAEAEAHHQPAAEDDQRHVDRILPEVPVDDQGAGVVSQEEGGQGCRGSIAGQGGGHTEGTRDGEVRSSFATQSGSGPLGGGARMGEPGGGEVGGVGGGGRGAFPGG
jgi:hypothetical protein